MENRKSGFDERTLVPGQACFPKYWEMFIEQTHLDAYDRRRRSIRICSIFYAKTTGELDHTRGRVGHRRSSLVNVFIRGDVLYSRRPRSFNPEILSRFFLRDINYDARLNRGD